MPERHVALSKLLIGVVAVAASWGLAGCAAAPPSPGDGPATPGEAEQPDPGASDPTDSGDEQRFGIDLETTAEVIAEALENVSGHEISGQTLTITFSEGSSGFDGTMDCLSVGGLMGDDEALILEYPDGAVEC